MRRVVRTVEMITGTSLPSIQDIGPKCCIPELRILSDTPPTRTIDCFLC